MNANSGVERAPLAAEARRCALRGEWGLARDHLLQLVAEVTGRGVVEVTINRDQYSLNSLNGLVTFDDDEVMFFKYHHEEGESGTVAEYYNAKLLQDAGFEVDVPRHACGEPGRQILLYTRREERRLADVCRELDFTESSAARAPVVAAQAQLDRDSLVATLATLRSGDPAKVQAEPVHQLFYHRLVGDGVTAGFGGRVAEYYVDQRFQLGELDLPWATFKELEWVINGVRYRDTLAALFAEAGQRLAPERLAGHGVVTAHGDAHNANVWYVDGNPARLVTFDPAFAGRQIPALLAEIKATFHNIFAHPLWLYEPEDAEGHYRVDVRQEGGTLYVDHDWSLTPLRADFLAAKGENYWSPLLAELHRRGWLPADWQRIVRLALFCCPTLVLNLRAGEGLRQQPGSSALGWALAVMLGSEPTDDTDVFSRWLQTLSRD